jgi:tetratricopeptide (TPR) repeat protein
VSYGDDEQKQAIVRSSGTDNQALFEELADSVAFSLRPVLGAAMEAHEELVASQSPRVRGLLREAELGHSRFEMALGRDDFASAQSWLEAQDSLLVAAEEEDPGWIEPTLRRARLAWHGVKLAVYQREGAPVRKALYENGVAHAERAIRAHPRETRALGIRGGLRLALWTLNRSDSTLLDEAESDLLAAVQDYPLDPEFGRRLGELYFQTDRFEDALAQLSRAHSGNPYLEDTHILLHRLGQVNLRLGHDEEARDRCAEGVARLPTNALLLDCALQLLALTGVDTPDVERAWSLLRVISQAADAPPGTLDRMLRIRVARVLVRAQLPDSARAVLETVSPETSREVGAAAAVWSALGDDDHAAGLLESYLAGSPDQREELIRTLNEERMPERESFRRLTEGGP